MEEYQGRFRRIKNYSDEQQQKLRITVFSVLINTYS